MAELYLSKSWTGEEQHRAGAVVPEARRFSTKQELAVRMMTRIMTEDAPLRWVTADGAYAQEQVRQAGRGPLNQG